MHLKNLLILHNFYFLNKINIYFPSSGVSFSTRFNIHTISVNSGLTAGLLSQHYYIYFNYTRCIRLHTSDGHERAFLISGCILSFNNSLILFGSIPSYGISFANNSHKNKPYE